MIGEPTLADELQIPLHQEGDIVAARQKGREMALQMGFGGTDLTVIATAISEVARNVLAYAHTGELVVAPIWDGERQGLLIIARDQGPGIEDVELAMQDGFSTSGGLGMGLPGVRRLMDHFRIESVPGRGTTVTLQKWTT